MTVPSEFDIINRYFSFSQSPDVPVGVGDDAALIAINHESLVVATDTLIEGVHFPEQFPAEYVASRAIGVNLSDFAAMGARPRWLTMALSLPDANQPWLASFAASLQGLCRQYDMALVGGDTTRSTLSISLTVLGTPGDADLPVNQRCLQRAGACAGDDLWVSGQLGKGAAGLALLRADSSTGSSTDKRTLFWPLADEHRADLLASFYAPKPRLALGRQLLTVATAAIDISDGLLADAQHIADRSRVGMEIFADRIPVHTGLSGHTDQSLIKQWVLTGGDDYELLFTAPASLRNTVLAIADSVGSPCTRIGKISEGCELVVVGDQWSNAVSKGYSHF